MKRLKFCYLFNYYNYSKMMKKLRKIAQLSFYINIVFNNTRFLDADLNNKQVLMLYIYNYLLDSFS